MVCEARRSRAAPAATAQGGEPSVFERFTCIPNSVLARPAWLVWVVRQSIMFRVIHTTPKRALSHLLRLQREGEGLLGEAEVGARAEAVWSDRVFKYLKRISEDPNTFERLMWNDVVNSTAPRRFSPDQTPRRDYRSTAKRCSENAYYARRCN